MGDPQGKLNNKKREIQKFTMVEGGLIAGDLEHAASPTKNPQNIKKTFQKPKAETVPNTKSQTKNKAPKNPNPNKRKLTKTKRKINNPKQKRKRNFFKKKRNRTLQQENSKKKKINYQKIIFRFGNQNDKKMKE